jgi:pSer/pThr/pTyr-binding forkhead associated (FHA) protein
MNGTFERKTISVPFYPESLRIGRQTNVKTVPTPTNGFFDSKVLSRQHAEIWGDRNGKIWIRDVKSSNGTFVNGTRLSPENRDSEPHELQSGDHLELGIDIVSEDQKTVVHHKVAAKVEHAGFLGASTNVLDMNFGDLDPANGALLLPSQGGVQMRGRTGSQGSIGSNGRMVPASSVAGSNMSGMVQQRPMNFWLTPVTTEQIVKKLSVSSARRVHN